MERPKGEKPKSRRSKDEKPKSNRTKDEGSKSKNLKEEESKSGNSEARSSRGGVTRPDELKEANVRLTPSRTGKSDRYQREVTLTQKVENPNEREKERRRRDEAKEGTRKADKITRGGSRDELSFPTDSEPTYKYNPFAGERISTDDGYIVNEIPIIQASHKEREGKARDFSLDGRYDEPQTSFRYLQDYERGIYPSSMSNEQIVSTNSLWEGDIEPREVEEPSPLTQMKKAERDAGPLSEDHQGENADIEFARLTRMLPAFSPEGPKEGKKMVRQADNADVEFARLAEVLPAFASEGPKERKRIPDLKPNLKLKGSSIRGIDEPPRRLAKKDAETKSLNEHPTVERRPQFFETKVEISEAEVGTQISIGKEKESAMVEKYRDKMSSFEAHIKSLQKEIASKDKKIKDIGAKLSGQDADLNEKVEEVKVLKREVEAEKKQRRLAIQREQSKEAELSKQRGENSGEVARLKGRVDELDQMLLRAGKDADEVTRLKGRVSELNQMLSHARKDTEEVARLKGQVSELNQMLLHASKDANEVARLKGRVNELDQMLLRAGKDADEVTRLKGRVSELNQMLLHASKDADEVARLKGRVNELDQMLLYAKEGADELGKLRHDWGERDWQVSQYEEQVRNLTARVKELEQYQEQHQQQASQLEAKLHNSKVVAEQYRQDALTLTEAADQHHKDATNWAEQVRGLEQKAEKHRQNALRLEGQLRELTVKVDEAEQHRQDALILMKATDQHRKDATTWAEQVHGLEQKAEKHRQNALQLEEKLLELAVKADEAERQRQLAVNLATQVQTGKEGAAKLVQQIEGYLQRQKSDAKEKEQLQVQVRQQTTKVKEAMAQLELTQQAQKQAQWQSEEHAQRAASLARKVEELKHEDEKLRQHAAGFSEQVKQLRLEAKQQQEKEIKYKRDLSKIKEVLEKKERDGEKLEADNMDLKNDIKGLKDELKSLQVRYELLNQGTGITNRLELELKQKADEITELRKEIERQEEFVIQAQKDSMERVKMRASEESQTVEDEELEGIFQVEIEARCKKWAYKYAIPKFNEGSVSLDIALEAEFVKMAGEQKESKALCRKYDPDIIINALIVQYITDNVFNKPFLLFELECGANFAAMMMKWYETRLGGELPHSAVTRKTH
jgi:chromosome segregation ATPase